MNAKSVLNQKIARRLTVDSFSTCWMHGTVLGAAWMLSWNGGSRCGEEGTLPAWSTAIFLKPEQCLAHSGAQEIFVK